MRAQKERLSIDRRREILQREIGRYVRKGFRVMSQTETTAQLLKPKKFSLIWFFLLLGIFYLPFYIAKKDKSIYLEVSAVGKIFKR